MNNPRRTFLIMLLVTVLGAAVAGWAGVQYGLSRTEDSIDLDAVFNHDLDLTPDQARQIRTLKAEFAIVLTELHTRIRASDRELAETITQRHSYDDQSRAAVERLHAAMSTLQEKTIQYVLAIRALLTPAQARAFDDRVSKALGAASS